MRMQFPSPKDILIVIVLLTLSTWQAQLVLAIISLLFFGFNHWIIGGLIGLVAAVAFTTRRKYHL